MNVIIIIVKKKIPSRKYTARGIVKQLKKQENDSAKETSCSYVTKKKTHTIKGFLTVQPSYVNSIKT